MSPKYLKSNAHLKNKRMMIIRTSSIFAFLVLLMIESAVGQALVKPGCQERCGNVGIIPYPFGIGTDCYMNKWFEVLCNKTFSPPTTILTRVGREVLNFSLDPSFVLVKIPITFWNFSTEHQSVNLSGSPFMTYDWNFSSIPEYFPAKLDWVITDEDASKLPHIYDHAFNCSQPTLSNDSFLFYANYSMALNTSTGQQCVCESGFEGNPYLPNGCQDIDECNDPRYNYSFMCPPGTICLNTIGGYFCTTIEKGRKAWPIILGISLGFGVVCSLIGTWWLYKILKKRRKKKLQRQFFKQNGGLLLQQQLSSIEGNVEKTKIFSTKELERATDNFNRNRILGQGGQGTVYKGMLVDGRIVAVKKSKVPDKKKVKEFINEVVILTQINHRNIVKLLGCCLETEVPMLVYEFIPNGTLFQYIHYQNEDIPLSWERRLTIAVEVAGALSYLHSAASIPIYHRDVKSSNILLDERYKAKVSNFGISRSMAIDQTHLTTNVKGTFGYLDPEYFRSSQFTEKSDVYSFGVVLVELLTGEKPISSAGAEGEEARGLAAHFILSMEENNLFNILDPQVRESFAHEDITKVAKLAYRCLSLSGKKRPKMIEVAVELEQIRLLQNNSNNQQNHEETGYVRTEVTNQWDSATRGVLSLDMGPLFSSESWGSLEMQVSSNTI